MIDRLDSLASKATVAQNHHLRLLHAYSEGFRGHFDSAIEIAKTLYAETDDPMLRLRASLLIANSAAATRNFFLGLDHLERSLEAVGGPDADPALREQALVVATIVYNQFGKFELSRNYAEQLLSLSPQPRSRCIVLQQRLSALEGLNRWPTDPAEVEQAINDCLAQGEQVMVNLIRADQAKSLARAGRTEDARALLSEHMKSAEATGYARLIGEFHSLFAEYLLDGGDLAGAKANAEAVLRTGSNNTASLPRVNAYKVLYEVALRSGRLEDALNNYRQYAQADKTYLDDVMARELAFQQIRNEVQQKDQAIALLSKQNEVLKLEQQVAHTSAQNTRLLLLLLGVVLAGIGYWAYKIKRVQMAFRRQAQTDGLTGISNRRHFRDAADAQLKRCGESGREAALVLLDLDNFKLINDRHGHAAGDWVLKQVAEACKAVCRDGDLCGRLGGEEFGILSCGGDADAARRIADRCRERLAAIDASQVGHDQRITASFGCTTSRRSGYVFETMFTDADTAMYRAKGSGRDRVVLHADDATPTPPPAVHGRLETSPG